MGQNLRFAEIHCWCNKNGLVLGSRWRDGPGPIFKFFLPATTTTFIPVFLFTFFLSKKYVVWRKGNISSYSSLALGIIGIGQGLVGSVSG